MTGKDSLTLKKVYTQKGERVEIAAGRLDKAIRLDALALESVAWQDDAAAIWTQLDGPDSPTPDETAVVLETGDSGEIELSNEYTHVTLSPGTKPNTVLLESVGLDYTIELDARALEHLAWQPNAYSLSRFLETPFGPEDVAQATKIVDTPSDKTDL